jgi:hypothetical protein
MRPIAFLLNIPSVRIPYYFGALLLIISTGSKADIIWGDMANDHYPNGQQPYYARKFSTGIDVLVSHCLLMCAALMKLKQTVGKLCSNCQQSCFAEMVSLRFTRECGWQS